MRVDGRGVFSDAGVLLRHFGGDGQLVVVSSADQAFHVVYDPRDTHVAVFSQDAFLFQLERDLYHTEVVVAVFWKVDDLWRLVFNRRHTGMSVYSLPQGVELFRDAARGEFLGSILPIAAVDAKVAAHASRFYWAWSWMWGPHSTPTVLDMKAIAEHGEADRKIRRVFWSEEEQVLMDDLLFNDVCMECPREWCPIKELLDVVDHEDGSVTLRVALTWPDPMWDEIIRKLM